MSTSELTSSDSEVNWLNTLNSSNKIYLPENTAKNQILTYDKNLIIRCTKYFQKVWKSDTTKEQLGGSVPPVPLSWHTFAFFH